MISFLVPTCNFNCSHLVKSIWRQADALRKRDKENFHFEIIVSDDASEDTEAMSCMKSEIADMPDVTILWQKKRLGRAANRNALITASSMPWKVFMDADAEVDATDFVERYWEARNTADVICGSLLVAEKQKGCELRYKYEKKASEIAADVKNRDPFSRFTVFNVMMNEKATSAVQFDENCREYGHEDTLYGLELKDAGLSVVHIDNPLIHTGLDCNEEFLQKSLTALSTLKHLPQLEQTVGSSRVFRKVEHLRLAPVLRLSAKLFLPIIRKNLIGHHPSLFLFNIYKLMSYSLIQ